MTMATTMARTILAVLYCKRGVLGRPGSVLLALFGRGETLYRT